MRVYISRRHGRINLTSFASTHRMAIRMTEEPDWELNRRLIAGDEEAYETVFRTWYAPLVRAAELILRERAVAEDVVQEVMIELWRRRAHLDPTATPQAYLFRSMRNRSLNHLRHLKVRQRAEPYLTGAEERDATAPSRLVAQEMQGALAEALAELTPRCRQVFELSRVSGLKYSEIADSLGITVKAVESQMGKALRTFRERLAPWLPKSDSL